MTNWLYAVITIFAQRFNICCANFGGRRRISPSSGYTPMATVTDGYVVLFFFVAIRNPYISHVGHEKHICHGQW